ncbi:aromatic/alkene monooxygenase hydroxylase subunit beta [Martelella sp. AD-3]|uniref:aromatic/alkene monooxygenase hydroxylase subunit beta n=1 Tax=Martelella sp. AD-3 TaxID=686597 RepID=UPI0004646627|nr:aromatic/alkene monooxygenase hydroxylase subunit beta [Martelella sp. AD-3]AMM84857.1 phenol hydroxylase [Martelella sp. AD-3]
MSIDLKTLKLTPRRQTFSHIARRFGEDRPASRYEEGMLDVQATAHFHYRPFWEPEMELYDPRRTAIVMADWYALRDPRQFYYATYNISRAGMREAAQHNIDFVEKRRLLDKIEPEWRQKVEDYLLPLRHVAWGANMNATQICDRGYGTAVTAPSMFAAGDQLGIAQLIGQIGMDMAGGTGEALDTAKGKWLDAQYWQGMRRLVEDTLVVRDWFELFVAQNLAIDGLLYPLVYTAFDEEGQKHGATAVSMVTEFMVEWFADQSRWADAVIRRAAEESDANTHLLGEWYRFWRDRTAEALAPLAAHVLGDAGKPALADLVSELDGRAGRLGLAA